MLLSIFLNFSFENKKFNNLIIIKLKKIQKKKDHNKIFDEFNYLIFSLLIID